MSIHNYKYTDLKPNEKNNDIAKLISNNLIPYQVDFDIHDIHVGIANAIRRVILSEIPVKSLFISNMDDFYTSDPFILNDFIGSRIANIPILQNIPDDSTFYIDVYNNTSDIMYVHSSEIKSSKNNKNYPFNTSHILIMLNPSKHIKIDKIAIKYGYGYQFGGFSLASSVKAIPIDVDMNNTPSSLSNPKNYKISFISNGSAEPKYIVILAINEIIKRLNNIKERLTEIESNGDIYLLVLEGESDTIGNIIMKEITELYPDIPAITYDSDLNSRIVVIKMRTNDDPKDIYLYSIASLIKKLEKITKDVDKTFKK